MREVMGCVERNVPGVPFHWKVFDSGVHNVRDEEHVDVDMDPIRTTDLAEETRSSGARGKIEEGRRDGRCRTAWADHVIVVVTDSSSLILVRESESVDQAPESGSSQPGHHSLGPRASRSHRKMARAGHGAVTKRCAEPVKF